MTITVELAPDLEHQLVKEAQRSGESVDIVASRVLAERLRAESQAAKYRELKPFALDVREKWNGLTPSEINYQMEIEAYEEKLRAAETHEADAAPRQRFVVRPIEGMKLPPEWISGCVQELIEILEGSGTRSSLRTRTCCFMLQPRRSAL